MWVLVWKECSESLYAGGVWKEFFHIYVSKRIARVCNLTYCAISPHSQNRGTNDEEPSEDENDSGDEAPAAGSGDESMDVDPVN
ncbi:hypothetical protein Tco_1201572 [Tanacetum coccineum]